MEPTFAKIITICLLFLVMLVSALLPIKLSVKLEKNKEKIGGWIISVLSCFGGGVFFGAYLLHLHPDVRDTLERAWLHPSGIDFPFAELFIGSGFFLMLYLESAVIRLGERTGTEAETLKDELSENGVNKSNDNGQNKSNDKNICEAEEMKERRCYPSIVANGTIIKSEKSVADNDTPAVAPVGAKARSMVLILALSLDCVFEGIAIGVEDNTVHVWNLLVAIISHEFIMSFCLGLELVKHYSTKKVIMGALLYAVMIPLGAGIGALIVTLQDQTSSTVDLCTGVLQALAAGCFIYVTFQGILAEELRIKPATPAKIVATTLGFGMMAALAAVPANPKDSLELVFQNSTILNTTAF